MKQLALTNNRKNNRINNKTKSKTNSKADNRKSKQLIDQLLAAYPEAQCELQHSNPFELLIATILSAQCTDKMVNQVTPKLFAKYPNPKALAKAKPPEVERLIHSTGFFRNKAKSIIGVAQKIVQLHGNEVPHSMEQLQNLPGVGRKTANVVLGNAFGLAEGIVVDTHVARLAFRLGLTKNTSPEKIESDLMDLVANKNWIIFSHVLIQHGRKVCMAKNPNCQACFLVELCPQNGLQ